MNISKKELEAIISAITSQVVAGLSLKEAAKSVTPSRKKPKALVKAKGAARLSDFSQSISEQLHRRLRNLSDPVFTIKGHGYTSLYAAHRVLLGVYSAYDWKKLQAAAEQFPGTRYTDPEEMTIETDDGELLLDKTYTGYGTTCVRLQDIEDIFIKALPRKGKKAVAEFRARFV